MLSRIHRQDAKSAKNPRTRILSKRRRVYDLVARSPRRRSRPSAGVISSLTLRASGRGEQMMSICARQALTMLRQEFFVGRFYIVVLKPIDHFRFRHESKEAPAHTHPHERAINVINHHDQQLKALCAETFEKLHVEK